MKEEIVKGEFTKKGSKLPLTTRLKISNTLKQMIIPMVKFDKVLNSRPAAREAFLRIKQMVNGSGKTEGIKLDFSGVEVLTPSYADELITATRSEYGNDKVSVIGANSIILETLKALSIEV